MNTTDKTAVKQQLLNYCLTMQQKRVEQAKNAMNEAQQAANEEERSTAGDKYDTSRAMSQNNRNMNAKQLQEALRDLAILQQMNVSLLHQVVSLGSVVKTTAGNYFIAISGGPFIIQGEIYFSISMIAPIGQVIASKKKGESFLFREKSVHIIEVF